MALFDLKDTAGAMHDVLDRERAAILSGRFDTLERLVPEKERLADRLARDFGVAVDHLSVGARQMSLF